MGTGSSFPGIKATEAWSWPLISITADVKNAWRYTSISPIILRGAGKTLPFTFTYILDINIDNFKPILPRNTLAIWERLCRSLESPSDLKYIPYKGWSLTYMTLSTLWIPARVWIQLQCMLLPRFEYVLQSMIKLQFRILL